MRGMAQHAPDRCSPSVLAPSIVSVMARSESATRMASRQLSTLMRRFDTIDPEIGGLDPARSRTRGYLAQHGSRRPTDRPAEAECGHRQSSDGPRPDPPGARPRRPAAPLRGSRLARAPTPSESLERRRRPPSRVRFTGNDHQGVGVAKQEGLVPQRVVADADGLLRPAACSRFRDETSRASWMCGNARW